MREEVERLHREDGWGARKISQELGISGTTVRRWLNPEIDEKMRATSRKLKEKYRGVCEDCGGQTSYTGGRKGKGRSARFCQKCYNENQHGRTWTREQIIAAIQRWEKEHGSPPSATQWIRRGEYHPALSTIYSTSSSLFGSWSEALRAAGFEPKRRSPGPGTHWWPRDEVRRQLAQGVPVKELAARYGVTPGAITNVFPTPRPAPVKKGRSRDERISDLEKALRQTNAEIEERVVDLGHTPSSG